MRLLRYGVMGRPIAHSLSPLIHQEFARQCAIALQYQAILVEEADPRLAIETFFKQGGCGLNITQPFKEQAYQLAQQPSPAAIKAKAVNTLWMQGDKLCADNTDGAGLIRDLSHYTELAHKRVLILGAGGAVRGILEPLLSSAPSLVAVVNRSLSRAQSLLDSFPGLQIASLDALQTPFDLMINATGPALTSQNLKPLEKLIHAHTFCYDLTYQQQGDTAFVAWAKLKGLDAVDGLGMLIEQAALSFFLWHGLQPDTVRLKSLLGRVNKCISRRPE